MARNDGGSNRRTRSLGKIVGDVSGSRPSFPETLGECVDLLYRSRQERLILERDAEAMRAYETRLKEDIILRFSKSDIEGARGKVATCSVTHATVAHIQDWPAFMEYVSKERAYDLLQRRVNDVAYRARLDEKLTVPGVEPFGVVKLSVQKRAK